MAAALRPRAEHRPGGLLPPGRPCALLGRRVLALDAEKQHWTRCCERLVEKTAPELLGRLGVGVDTAATLLVTAGDNPGPHPLRSRLGAPVRGGAHPGVVGQGDPCAPRPGRRPPSQFGLCGS